MVAVILVSFILGKQKLRKFLWSFFSIIPIYLTIIFANLIRFINFQKIQSRYFSIFRSPLNFFGNALSQNSDQSLQIRQYQGAYLKEIWESNKITGVGVLNIVNSPILVSSDNFYASLATFGLLGTLFLLISLLGLLVNLTKILLNAGHNPISLISYLFTVLISTSIYNWPQDKGLWLGLLSLVAFEISIVKY
jgi:hypothetical protein